MFANSLIPRRTCGPATLGSEFDRLFGQMLGTAEGRISTFHNGDWQARLAVWEKDNTLHMELEVPGVLKEDIELTVEDGDLKIAGQRKEVEEVEDADRQEHYSERHFGRFERVVRLPKQFDLDSVAAEMTDGVLHVTVAKTPESQPKKIEVK